MRTKLCEYLGRIPQESCCERSQIGAAEAIQCVCSGASEGWDEMSERGSCMLLQSPLWVLERILGFNVRVGLCVPWLPYVLLTRERKRESCYWSRVREAIAETLTRSVVALGLGLKTPQMY